MIQEERMRGKMRQEIRKERDEEKGYADGKNEGAGDGGPPIGVSRETNIILHSLIFININER